MTITKTLAAVLFAVVAASCETLQGAKSETKGTVSATEPDVVTRVEYLPGKVVNTPYPVPDSSLVPDVAPLTEEHISGADIPPEDAMASAVAWARQYHDLATTYDILRGWIIGVRAGQSATKGEVIPMPPGTVLNEAEEQAATP